MNSEKRWQRVARSLALRQPLAVLLRERRVLGAWRRAAEGSGYYWLEGNPGTNAAQPFLMWHDLTQAPGGDKELSRRLQEGAPTGRDADNPLSPDPAGTYDAISRWVRRLAAERPTVLVCAVDRGTRDCFAALRFVLRSLDRDPVALVLLAAARYAGSPWEETIAELQQEIGVLTPDAAAGGSLQRPASRGPLVPLEVGLAHCRTGALYTGTQMLVDTLSAITSEVTPPLLLAEAWQEVAMASLRLHDYDVCAHATARVLKLPVLCNAKRRARRTWMLALRQREDRVALAELFRACESELAGGTLSRACAAWANLDLALATSLGDSEDHEIFLERVLATPVEDVSRSCLAVAYIWRGAAHLMRGEIELALSCQEKGLVLLVELEEFTRALHVRVRVGAMLAGVGRFDDAAALLRQATRDAVAAGEFTMAAISAAEAAAAALAAGNLTGARASATLTGWKGDRVWGSPLAQLLRLRVDAQIALGEHSVEAAAALVSKLVEGALSLPEEQLSWRIRLICEASYLQSDVARAKGQPGDEWLQLGLNWAEQAAAEERALLIAAGVRRLASAPDARQRARSTGT